MNCKIFENVQQLVANCYRLLLNKKHGWVELAEAQQSRGEWFTEELTSDILLRQCSHNVTLLTQDVTTLRLYFLQKYRYFIFIFVHNELIVLSPSVADGKHFISILTRLQCFDKLFLSPCNPHHLKKLYIILQVNTLFHSLKLSALEHHLFRFIISN